MARPEPTKNGPAKTTTTSPGRSASGQRKMVLRSSHRLAPAATSSRKASVESHSTRRSATRLNPTKITSEATPARTPANDASSHPGMAPKDTAANACRTTTPRALVAAPATK